MFVNLKTTWLGLLVLGCFTCLSGADVPRYHLPPRTSENTRPQRSPVPRPRLRQISDTGRERAGGEHQESSWRPRPWWVEPGVQPYSLNSIQRSTNGQCLRVTYCQAAQQRHDLPPAGTSQSRSVYRRFVRPAPRIRDFPHVPFPDLNEPWPPIQAEKMDELRALKESLGVSATYVYDEAGEVVGVTLLQTEVIRPPMRGNRPKPDNPPQESRPGDSDNCCSTREAYFLNSTLVDIQGRVRRIAQYQHIGNFQIIRHGMCGNKGGCRGQCREKHVMMQLMVHPPENGQKVTLKFFKVPAYCVCQYFGSS